MTVDPSGQRKAFIEQNTAPIRPPLVPEIELRLADEAHELWHKTEAELQAIGLPPPFWAFAWAGGQALARYVLDCPKLVEARNVFDLASGSGLVAIAAKLAGAAQVTANDIDPHALAAIELNARANGTGCLIDGKDRLDEVAAVKADVVLAGDVFYDRDLAARAWPWLQRTADKGRTVLIGDPGRSYLPKQGLRQLAEYRVPVTRALEDSEVKHTAVYAVTAG